MKKELFMALDEAVWKNKKTEVAEILSSNPEFFKNPRRNKLAYSLLKRALVFNQDPLSHEIVKLLLEFGVDPNFENPLELVLREDKLHLAGFLLENGAILTDKNMISLFACILGLKVNNDNDDEVIMYNDQNENDNDRIFCFFFNDNHYEKLYNNNNLRIKLSELLINYGPIFASLTIEEKQILLDNLKKKIEQNEEDTVVEIAEILIKSGVPFDGLDGEGKTLLHYTSKKKNLKLATFLISKGVDVNKRNLNGNTPLHVAARFEDNMDMINLLLCNGAQINAKNENKHTVLHISCLNYHDEIINLMIQKGANICEEEVTPLYCVLMPEHDHWGTLRPEHEDYHRPDHENYDKCMKIMVKEFAKRTFENLPVLESDMNLIRAIPETRDFFESCMEELNQMEVTDFFGTYSYLTTLTKSVNMKKLARRVKNEEFLVKFEVNLKRFPCYENDLKAIFNEALLVREDMLKVEERLKYIFGEYLPDLVLWNLAENLSVEDLPLE